MKGNTQAAPDSVLQEVEAWLVQVGATVVPAFVVAPTVVVVSGPELPPEPPEGGSKGGRHDDTL